MCLDKISKKKPAPEGYGYKVFDVFDSDGELHGEFARRNKIRPVGTWLNSRSYSAREEDSYISPIKGKYPVGWHIFKSLAGVENWVYDVDADFIAIRRVRYRQAHTEGTTEGYKVIVAKEIYIIP